MYMTVDILYRMSYMKANVHQVYRYLTAYLNAGGSFPEKENSRIRNLASEVGIFYYSSKILHIKWGVSDSQWYP